MFVGQQILNYRINYLIGEGGMGSVYLATHLQLGRKVAIKALNPALAKNPMIRERFRNEAATLSQLQHPNIVTLYDYLEEDDALYLIMEYAEGLTLDEYIRTVSGPIPEDKAIPLFAKVLDAFAYAHEQGVVHRDIKPSNIIITPENNVKILDFGIAKIINQSRTLTRTGTKMGTVLYMSPEQVKGEPVDRRSDIYSLGITLFQILTGRTPYDEQNATEFAIYNKIVNEPLPSARQFYPGISARMESIIAKATEKNPADRFQYCQDFKEVLQGKIIAPAPIKTTQYVQPSPQKPASPKTEYQQTYNGSSTVPKKQRSGGGIGLIAGLLFMLAVIAAIFFWSGDNEKDPEETPSTVTQPSRQETPTQAQQDQADTENPLPQEPAVNAPITQENTAPVLETLPKSELIAQYIQLEYEIPGSDPADAALSGASNNRFFVRIVLRNTSTNIRFDNVTLKISYLDANGSTIGNYLYEHGTLPAGTVERFIIERSVPGAVGVNCSITSAEPVNPSAGSM